ncbi:MAG: deoxyribose-phosphate aldolase [Oscillospiraceae bacterium]|nr:deoxyribose-phosphate aldolase [Oscillospiraceae bacterium]
MNMRDILSRCDHTLLRPEARAEEIIRLCDEGMKYGTASVCIPPCCVPAAKEHVKDRLRICTVIGFPNGYSTTAVKLAETKDAQENGADEIDMVINISDLKSGRFESVAGEIKELKSICGRQILKVIIETCLLSDDEKKKMCEIVSESGADFIKTSTGFSTGGATGEDVALLRKYCASHVKIKASGGISTIADAENFIELGADRLGTSRIVKLAAEAGL